MQAVILAAGMGKRLLPLTSSMPKSMVKINGVPIITRALDQLVKLGNVTEVIIVVGYRKETIKELGLNYKGMNLVYVDNDDYDTTNNIYSLWLATEYIKTDFILLEGDLLFEFKMLEELMNYRDKNVALVAKYEDFMDGTVVTLDSTNQIKQLIPKSDQGTGYDYSDKYKTVNIYYFTHEFYQKYFKPNLGFYIQLHGKNDYYELILGMLVYLKIPNIYAHVVENIKWMEVDDANDLEIANYLFLEDKKEIINKISSLHGGYWRFDFLDFCYLFNLYFPDETLYSKLKNELPSLINNYPSAQHKMVKLLSRWYKEDCFNEENLIVGNGASEFIRILNKNLVKKVTIPLPTFNEYENQLSEDKINYFSLSEEFDLNVSEFIESVKNSGSNFALIINPNNPTSTVLSRGDIRLILDGLKGVAHLIVDESFIDFSGREKYSVQDLVGEYDNLIVIRSLSKEFGIPGLRLGYILTTDGSVKEKIKEHLPIWNINSIAERFLELFIKFESSYKLSIKRVVEDREDFFEKLKEIPFLEPIKPHANFILCKLKNAGALKEKLFSEHNILIKDCSNKKGLVEDAYIRLTVRKKEDNDRLISALRESLN